MELVGRLVSVDVEEVFELGIKKSLVLSLRLLLKLSELFHSFTFLLH